MGDDPEARRRWNRRYRDRPPPEGPSPFLTARADLLPDAGRALDLAGGGGRNAVWLAQRGFEVTLIDVSDEACAAARVRADAAGVQLTVLRRALEIATLPAGPFAVVLSNRYLDPEVWRAAAELLGPDGRLLISQPTVRNLERHARPPRDWLLDEGALAAFAATLEGLEVIELTEGWTDEDRHEARAVLRRPLET